SKTFRWHGKYHEDVNQRDTVSVELNVLGEAGPTIPQQFRDSKYVFLANTHPALQIELLAQLDKASLVVADTMDIWIENDRELLLNLLARIDGLVLNDSEATQLTGKSNIVQAGIECSEMVRRFVVVKKGEHGSLLFVNGKVYPIPGYPAEKVVDPTGAGDSFAGGMMGYIAEKDIVDPETLHRAIAYGTIVASIELEDFSLNRFTEIDRSDIDARFTEFKELTVF
ncbi:MAG: sugar kinase, partial [bacterium]|nr:sugar kinase [bacterium]